MKLDDLDKKILSIISNDAKIPFCDIAIKCNVSRAAIHQHITKMFNSGIITGSCYTLKAKLLGYSTCTYIGIRLEKASLYKDVLPQLKAIPELVECHYTTGNYNILAKLYAKDNDDLMVILSDKIQSIPGVASTETLISLSEGFTRNIPIPEEIDQIADVVTRGKVGRPKKLISEER